MSKVSFRARALDASRPMPVFRADEIPDLPDFATINRSVPQMPTGMEKEEETEHHLQRALSAQQVYGTSEDLVIPIPDIDHIERYDNLYKNDFKIPKQYVHMQAINMDQEIPDYDMDSDDEVWLNDQSKKKMELSALKFEEMMDRLEKGSGQQVVTLQEAKALLKEDDDLIIAVYDYWLNKRLKMQHPLILSVKTEKRDGSTTNNPYVAFRRRTEKMQTRKNRKNDEVSYEKMLKLKRDITRALTLIEMIKRREKTKKEMLQLTIEVLETRYQMEDFSGKHLAEAEELRHSMKPAIVPTLPVGDWGRRESAPVKKKREYKKRKSKANQQQQHAPPVLPFGEIDVIHPDVYSSDDEGLSPGMSTSDHEDENDPDGIFAFRRKKNCTYHAPLLGRPGNWPWYGSEDGGLGDNKYRYSLTSIPPSHRCLGFGRRRVGRGGRVLFDRASTEWDDALHKLNVTNNNTSSHKGVLGDYLVYIRERKIPHFRPRSPPPEDILSYNHSSPSSTPVNTEFNPESFHTHQEQLMQMQRDQREQMLRQETSGSFENNFSTLNHSLSSTPTSNLTLDSASARFAASAVINSAAQLNVQPPSSTPITTTAPSTPTTVTNGPVTVSGHSLPEKPSGLSTRPAAPVLRLNFPINNVMSAISTTESNTILKVSTAASSPIDTKQAQNHEETVQVNNLTPDRVVAMDVT